MDMKTRKRYLMFLAASVAMIFVMLMPCTPTQAAKKSVYVVAKIKGQYDTKNYSYNSSGFVTSVKSSSKDIGKITYKYNSKNRIISSSAKAADYNIAQEMTYKGGKLFTVREERNYSDWNSSNVTTYTWEKGRCTKEITKYSGDSYKSAYKYKYYKNGYIKSVNAAGPMDSLNYDSKGNVSKLKHESADEPAYVSTYTNNYKNGLLISQKVEMKDDEVGTIKHTIKYNYKKIKVDQKYLKRIKAQQRRIITDIGPNLAVY